MGALCSCFRAENEVEYANPNSPRHRNCVSFSFLLQNIRYLTTTLTQGGGTHSLPSSLRGNASVAPDTSLDDSALDTFQPPPRPLPYDADLRRPDGPASRCVKGSSHSHSDGESGCLRNDVDAEAEQPSLCDKVSVSVCEAGSKDYVTKSLKLSPVREVTACESVYSSSEDEDVCPTCLEEYTPENPKIETKCSHHFHLGCIYEWMERSDSCPVCFKVMEFSETA